MPARDNTTSKKLPWVRLYHWKYNIVKDFITPKEVYISLLLDLYADLDSKILWKKALGNNRTFLKAPAAQGCIIYIRWEMYTHLH